MSLRGSAAKSWLPAMCSYDLDWTTLINLMAAIQLNANDRNGRESRYTRAKTWRALAMDNIIQTWSPRLLSVLRIVAVLLFVEHGTSKLLHFPPVDMFNDLQPFTLIWFAGVLELVGGALLTLGLFTRPVAF